VTLVMQRTLPNIVSSVLKYLKETQYTVGSDTKVLAGPGGFFTDLLLFPAYPDDLVKLKTPVLALGTTELSRFDPDVYGSATFGLSLRLPLYGFVCNQKNAAGQVSDAANKAYRDKLMSDLVELFAQDASNIGITLYDAVSKQEVGEIEIVHVAARALPVNAPNIDADRYKFLVEIDAAYTSITTQ